MKKPVANVSDHAVLRYIERVLCVDVEALRAQIGQRVDKMRAVELGASAVISEGWRYVVVNGCVVTVVAPVSTVNHPPRRGREADE